MYSLFLFYKSISIYTYLYTYMTCLQVSMYRLTGLQVLSYRPYLIGLILSALLIRSGYEQF
jgi:hypothetical protein